MKYEWLNPKKLSAANHEAPELLEIDSDENYLYQIENMILDKAKEKIEWCKRAI